jgi:2-oxoglutarate ferredoxin oxidoreductase subunit alpha
LHVSTWERIKDSGVKSPGSKADSLVIAIVGSGGDGVALLGSLLLKMAADQGLYGMMVQSFGPQIRGGDSAVVLRISTEEVAYEGNEADLLLCFRLADLERFQISVRLHPESKVILEAAEEGELPARLRHRGMEIYRYPFRSFDENGVEMPSGPKNMMGLALICRALGWSDERVREIMQERFGKKPEVLKRNLEAFDRAWGAEGVARLPHLKGTGKPLIHESGNEAVARGAIRAGVRFFAGYPITPSSEIMETLIRELPAAGGRVVQAEDEIAAMGMVIGASFGGVPSMTATSGPGLSLMTEMMGLSSMAELPAVIVNAQRAGPATGMPSRTEQSDLFHAVFGGHGDFPRAVLGVFDVVHAYAVMYKAFYLAEKYQMPVTVLSDAYIAQRRQIHDPIDENRVPPQRRIWQEGDGPYRFEVADQDVVSPFRVPGTPGGTYMAAGIEHSAEGSPSAETNVHHQMNAKRFAKIPAVAAETGDWYRTLGRDDAHCGIITWGSQYGLLREWVGKHTDFRVFMPEILHPFPLEAFEKWRKGLRWTGVVELNYQGQFHHYLGGLTDMVGVHSLARSGGVHLKGSDISRMVAEAME